MQDHNHFRDTGSISLPEVPVATHSDVLFRWAALMLDLQRHGIAVMVRPSLSHEAVEDDLTADSPHQIDLVRCIDGSTQVPLSALRFNGTDPKITAYTSNDNSTQMAVGARALQFFSPTGSGENSDVELLDACRVLDREAEQLSSTRTPVNVEGPWPLIWLDLTLDGQDESLRQGKASRVVLACYDGQTRETLQEPFLDLKGLAGELWTLNLFGGAAADLGGLTHAQTGEPFAGFTMYGAKLLALRCSTWPNSAPCS